MTPQEIRRRLQDLAAKGHGVVFTDAGSGSAGPGYADSATLRQMLEAGDFEEAEVEPLSAPLQAVSFAAAGAHLDSQAAWAQIRYAWRPHYSQVCWLAL